METKVVGCSWCWDDDDDDDDGGDDDVGEQHDDVDHIKETKMQKRMLECGTLDTVAFWRLKIATPPVCQLGG